MVKEFLSLRGVQFVEKNVSTDLEGRAELVAMGYDTTPVTLIGKQRLEGFSVPAIDAAIADLKDGNESS
jgi:glutaredoxin 3